MQLKNDNTAEQLKVASDHQSEQDKAGIKKQQLEDEYELKRQAQEREAALAHAKALDDFNLKRDMLLKEHELACEMADKEHGLAKEKQETDKKLRMQESGIKADTDVVPKIMDKLDKALDGMASILERIAKNGDEQLKLTQELIAAQERPRSVSLSGIQRGADGMPTGAIVKPTLQ